MNQADQLNVNKSHEIGSDLNLRIDKGSQCGELQSGGTNTHE